MQAALALADWISWIHLLLQSQPARRRRRPRIVRGGLGHAAARWGWTELNVYGWPLIVAIILLARCCGHWHWLLVPVVLLAWLVSFFRDPPRRIPETAGMIVSPADGKVAEVTQLDHYDFLDGAGGVDRHLSVDLQRAHQSAPFAGRAVDMHYKPGEFQRDEPASAERNESMWIGFETDGSPPRRFAVRQISGAIARRIVCPLAVGQAVNVGRSLV
jgi:phosphatidylserine decarboxylase